MKGMPKWLCIWNLGHETPHACMPMKVFSLMSLDEKKYDVLKIPHTTVIRRLQVVQNVVVCAK